MGTMIDAVDIVWRKTSIRGPSVFQVEVGWGYGRTHSV